MNVSMQDGFDLGRELGHVLSGRSPESRLSTCSTEPGVIAQNLIDFDKERSTLMAKRPEELADPAALESGRPLHFSGDAAVSVVLPAGPVRALNVIAGRGTVRARVTVRELSTGRWRQVPAGSRAVLSSGRAVVEASGTTMGLLRFGTVRGEVPGVPEVAGHGLLADVFLTDRGPTSDLEPATGS